MPRADCAWTVFWVSISFAFGFLLYFSLAANAQADTGPYENLPPASIGNRNASLFLGINPPVLTSGNFQDAHMTFRLFDANNNQTILFTTYYIRITKGISPNAHPLVEDFFQSPDGLLSLKIQPAEGPVVIYGNREPILNALVADPGGTVNIKGPVFKEGGLYHFHVEIFGIDNARNIFNDTAAPKFDTYLNVGDVTSHSLELNGKQLNSTLISYFDKVDNFNFKSETKEISWSMPFYWNTTLLKSSIAFLHQELRVPKSLVNSSNPDSYNATANGLPVVGRMLSIDPYTYEDAIAIHILLNKDDLVSMSRSLPPGNGVMNFTLSPVENATLKTTTDTTTETGGIHVVLGWKPSQLHAADNSTLTLSFSDSAYGGSLKANVKYDLVVASDNGTQVIKKSNQLAMNGIGQQAMTFDNNGVYHIQVNVKELDRFNQVPDFTRNGIARGAVVVPEFDNASFFIAVSGLVAVLVVARRISHTFTQ